MVAAYSLTNEPVVDWLAREGTMTAMRRLVAGVDADGRSCVLEETILSTPIGERSVEAVYQTSTSPPPVRPPGSGVFRDLGVPPGVARWIVAQFGPGETAAMHHTDTVDFDTIIAGSIDLVLDDGAHPLHPGDCVLVSGVDHAWAAGPEGCVWSCVVVGTPPRVD